MERHFYNYLCITILTLFIAVGCKPAKTTNQPVIYNFSADSAYQHIVRQLSFGPRVPSTPPHYQCAKYIESTLHNYGLHITIQQGAINNYKGEEQPIYNIIGSYTTNDTTPSKATILLCAHWDTRPWADEEELYDDRLYPVDGANDGASGVAVLLELARQITIAQPNHNIDFLFLDAEDMGTPRFYTGKERENTWCLGSQLWAKQYQQDKQLQQTKNYQYAILLDMVGDKNAVFPHEYFSWQYAQNYSIKLWRTASQLGYGHLFINAIGNPVTDDHYYINTIANIPCIDIIHYDNHTETGFPPYWHTRNDNINNISHATLEAVGKTVLNTILN